MKVWSSKKADTEFSKYIRERDGKCIRCGKKENLQCSHFWARQHSATRYNPLNADTLCYSCHYGNQRGWEYDKQGEYRQFKINQLGIQGYNDLEATAKSTVKRYDAIVSLMALLKVLEYVKM